MKTLLCGLPRVGKSTYGRLLAEKLAVPFVDVDTRIEATYAVETGIQKSCSELFRQYGAEGYRERELHALLTLEAHPAAIVALGGGIFEDDYNLVIARGLGRVIYLKGSVEHLFPRFGEDIPPYLDPSDPEGSFAALAAQRSSNYERGANHTIDTDALEPSQVVDALIALIRRHHG